MWRKAIRVCFIFSLLAAFAAPARPGDYSFDLPQLLGHHLGDIPSFPTFDLEVDLGTEFAEIGSASLLLAGTHTPGLAGDLNSPYSFLLPAEIVAWSDRPAPTKDVFIDQVLPTRDGLFQFDEPFRALGPPGSVPDFSPWFDGTAEFHFSMYTPPMLAIYYLVKMPSVTITSATLVIEGRPNLDEFTLPGDFNGDGLVDGHDLLAWQRNPIVGSLESWQMGYGSQTLATSMATPEPGSCVLLVLAGLVPLRLRR